MATVRVGESTRETLRAVAAQLGTTMGDVLAEAVEQYARRVLLEEMNRGYAALKADPTAWAEEVAEREAWDTTLGDGLDDL